MCKAQCKKMCGNGQEITTATHLCPAMKKKLESAEQFAATQQQPIIIESNGVRTADLIIL